MAASTGSVERGPPGDAGRGPDVGIGEVSQTVVRPDLGDGGARRALAVNQRCKRPSSWRSGTSRGKLPGMLDGAGLQTITDLL
jgi:hypothetical protein